MHYLLTSPNVVAEFKRKNAGKRLQSKAKETSQKEKRKEAPSSSGGRNKRQEVENGDVDNSD